VRDQEQGARVFTQPAFQPENRVDVEMVGRLIQQQQVGTTHQRAGHIDAHPPAAGEGADRPRLVGRIEAETVHQLAGTRTRVVAADFREAGMQRTEALALVALLRLGNAPFDGAQLGIAVENEVDR